MAGWRAAGGGNTVGALLDPVADKALLVTMYVTLAAVNELPDWLAILVVFRDVVIVGGVHRAAVLGHAGGDPPAVCLQAEHRAADRAGGGALLLAGFGCHGADRHAGADLGWWPPTTLASGAAYVWITAARRDDRR